MPKKLSFLLCFMLLAGSIQVFAAPADNSAAAKAEITGKLDKIAKNHEAIIKELEEIKKELYIIKIRASR